MDFWTAVVCIVGIGVFGNFGLSWIKNRQSKLGKKDLAKIKADLDELKTQVNRIHEQQYDQERAAKAMATETELYQDLQKESR